jgi:GH15 family glucan-1,4-alpha-glucosidase
VAAAYRPIGDYAIIGDCRSAALISRDGSIDWFCLPLFDRPSVFAAILDGAKGGRFRVSVAGTARLSRRYIGNSAVLETTFTTPDGVLRLTDAMPVADEATKSRSLWPDHEVVRRVECVEGEAVVEVVFEPRPDYGRAAVRLRAGHYRTILCEIGPQALTLRSDVPLTIDPDRRGARGRLHLTRGESAVAALTFTDGLPAVLPAHGRHAEAVLEGSVEWWERWASQCEYDWDYREAIVRSAVTLKLLTYAPSGAMIAAPTTSLPEKIGGVRNWDYRYCWLRDASLTLCALVDLGFGDEAEAFLSWVLHATRLTQPKLQILYDVYGEPGVPEHVLDHLDGYAGSRPVRIGNGAAGQLQFDVYGEVVDAAFQLVARGGHIDRATSRLLVGLGNTVCAVWREPDEGIWEARADRRHNTYSKVLCWVALDRLIRLHQEGHLKAPVERFRAERDAIQQEVEARAWNERMGTYVSVLDGDALDASLLRLATSGYTDPNGSRMRRTADAVRRRLGTNGLIHRYHTDDGLPPGEGAFTICSFWSVQSFALEGQLGEARREFERLLGYRNDLGLLSEEIDVESGALLGNFPQAFSHIGLINAALTLSECSGARQARKAAAAGGKKL